MIIDNIYNTLTEVVSVTLCALKEASLEVCRSLREIYERKQTEELRNKIIEVVHEQDSFLLKYILDEALDKHSVYEPHELLTEVFASASGPFNVNQLKMAKSILKRNSEPLPQEPSERWFETALIHQDLPLIKLLVRELDPHLFIFHLNTMDPREPIFEEILYFLSREQSKEYFEKAVNSFMQCSIDNSWIENFEYLLNSEALQPFVKNILGLRIFNDALNAESPRWIQMLIDKVDRIPFSFLTTLVQEDHRELFDQAIKKATWDHLEIRKYFTRLARKREINPDDPIFVEKAYYTAQMEKYFGPVEQDRIS